MLLRGAEPGFARKPSRLIPRTEQAPHVTLSLRERIPTKRPFKIDHREAAHLVANDPNQGAAARAVRSTRLSLKFPAMPPDI
jgi:hypothetical protein